MSPKLFELIQIAAKLATHIWDDVQKGDPAVKDVEEALSSLKVALGKVQPGDAPAA